MFSTRHTLTLVLVGACLLAPQSVAATATPGIDHERIAPVDPDALVVPSLLDALLDAQAPDRPATPLDGAWNRIPSGGQVFHMAVYDSLRDRLIVLGGWYGGAPTLAVRALDLSGGFGWLDLTPTNPGPTALTSASAILDPVRDRIVVFGGENTAGAPTNEIWALSLSEPRVWTQLAPGASPAPGARSDALVVHDPHRDQLIVYGGVDAANNVFADVWTFSYATETWSNPIANVAGGAGFRQAPAGIYDPVRRRLVVQGGYYFGYLADAWSLDLDSFTWQQLPNAPIGLYGHRAVYDASQDRMVIHGGSNAITSYSSETYTLSLSGTPAWLGPNPAPGATPATWAVGVLDSRRFRMLVHGGINESWMYEDVRGFDLGLELWLPVTTDPPQPRWRSQSPLAFDAARNQAYFFGGAIGGGAVGNTVWSLGLDAPERWTEVAVSGPVPARPTGRRAHVAVVDPVLDRLVIYGGSAFDGTVRYSDVWALPLAPAMPAWSQIVFAGGPGARNFASGVWDPIGNRMLVFGGTTGTSQSDLWALNFATGWTRLAVSGSGPSARNSSMMVFDPTRNAVIVFGGQLASGLYANDVWRYSLGGTPGWTNITPIVPGPSARRAAAMVYDAAADRVVIHGGSNGTGAFGDLWALQLSGTPTWVQLAPEGAAPEGRRDHSAVYDPAENRLILYGGTNGSNFLRGDTWSLQWQRLLAGTDLTTTDASPFARYLVNLGTAGGGTRDPGVAGPAGIHEFSSAPGIGQPWWAMNDGAPSAINTFGGTSPDYFGWNFKHPVTIRGLRFDNLVDGLSGTFQSTPNVQVFDGNAWQTVAATWEPAYDPSLGTEVRSYAVTLVSPASGVRGLRLLGDAAGNADGDGYIGVSEMAAVGDLAFPRPIDFAVDLAGQPGTEAFLQGGFTVGAPEDMIDDDLATGANSSGQNDPSLAGVYWSSSQDSVTALGLVFGLTAGAGALTAPFPFAVEVTGNYGASWQPVSGLELGTYPSDLPGLAALPGLTLAGYLFTFDPVDGINGIRVTGTATGTGQNYLAVHELEVFATSALELSPPGPPLEISFLGGVNPAGYTASPSPTLQWTAAAPGIDPALNRYRTWFDHASPFLATTREEARTWPDAVILPPEVGPAVPPALFQSERNDAAGASSGALTYRFPVANGNYEVHLYFAEMDPAAFAAGSRVFDAVIEGGLAGPGLDVYALAGERTAYRASYVVPVLDGELEISLEAIAGAPSLEGIEVVSQPDLRSLYRVNCGGPALAAADLSFPGWSADQDGLPDADFTASEEATYAAPIEGLHHLRLDARAPGAQRDSDVRLFTVDATAPSVALVAPSPEENALVSTDAVDFGVTGADNAVRVDELLIEASVDGVVQLTAAPGTLTISGLASGERLVSFRSRDLAGNWSAPVERTVRVDLVAPETFITSPADGATFTTSTVQLEVAGTDDQPGSVRFSVAVDAGAFGAVVDGPTIPVTNLADGTHTLRVRAVDAAGNADPTPAEVTIVIDATAPVLAFTVAPAPLSCIATSSALLEWSASDAVTPAELLQFETRLDAAAFTPVGAETSATFGPLAAGQHTVSVRVTDQAGNQATITRSFTVDVSPPSVFAPTVRLLDAALLSFACSGTDDLGVVSLQLQVATVQDFTTLVADQLLGSPFTFQLVATPGQTYFFRSRALDCAGNMSAWSDPAGAIAVPSLPDLLVDQVDASVGAVVAGQSFGVRWVVRNDAPGGTSTPNWRDRLYLSADATLDLDGTDIFLADFANLTHLAPGELYVRDEILTLPRGIAGAYRVIVVTDFHDELPEAAGNNNALASGIVNVTPADAADLEVTELQTLPFETWFAGSNMRVAWTVGNDGSVPPDTDRWYDTVFLSEDATFDVQVIGNDRYQFLDRPIGTVERQGVVAPGATYTQDRQIRLPLDVQARDYWLFVVADHRVTTQNEVVPQSGVVFENGADLNVSPAFRIHAASLLPANLVIDPVTAPAAAVSGQSIPVSWTVENEGDMTVVNLWVDRVYLSMDDLLDAGDVLLGSQTRGSALGQLASYDVTLPVQLPAFIEGTYRILVQTDATGLLVESDETDNVLAATDPLVITLAPSPDLVIEEGSAPTSATAGTSFGVQWRGRNAGSVAVTGSWSDRLYLTTGAPWNPAGAIALASFAGAPNLAEGGVYDRNVTVGLPFSLAAGTYAVWVVADANGQVVEHLAEDNNVTQIGTVTVGAYPLVDLEVTPVSAPAEVGSGASASVEWRVTNHGAATTVASSWRDRVYLSSDAVLDGGDVALATMVRGGALAADASYDQSATITLPNGTAGTYYLLVRTDVDDVTGDGNPTNDVTSFASQLVVTATPPPNLTVESIDPDPSPVAGQPFEVRWTERNTGDGPTRPGAWSTYVYASLDPVFGNGDEQILGSAAAGAPLATGEARAASATFDMPRHYSGPYYLFVRVDATSGVYESDEGDNIGLAPPIQVAQAPPADLVVTAVTPPVQVIPGRPATVSWTIENVGENPATGVMRDVVYLSTDPEFNVETARVLGLVTRTIDLAPGQGATSEAVVKVDETFMLTLDGELVAAVPALSPGPHYAFVRTNVLRNIRESDYENNVFDPGTSFDVVIPVLPIDGEDTATLAPGEAAFWRIITPPGQDLLVTVESSQAGATNELFASFGQAPDPRTFEFSGPAEFTPTPSLAIPSTADGSYFIRLSNNTLPAGFPNTMLTVRARLLPYSVTSITPNRAGGVATCTVRGAGFRDITRFAIDYAGPTGNREVAVVSLVNSGLAIVRVDVSGLPPGTYPLRAWTGAELTTLEDAFTVEPATPLEVATSIEGSDVIRQNATATHTVRFRNLANRDVPILRARILLAPEVEVVNLATTGGLKRRSDLWPEQFEPVMGDVETIIDTARDDSVRAIDVFARDIPPGQDVTLILALRGFGRDTHTLRTLLRLDEETAFLHSLVDGIEEARQEVLARGVLPEPSLEPLLGNPFSMRDAALTQTYVNAGLVDPLAVERFLRGLAAGELGTSSGGPPPAPPELDPGSGPCDLPNLDPGCTLREAGRSELPACRSCFTAVVPQTLLLPSRLDVSSSASTCEGYTGTASRDFEVVSPCDPNLIASASTPSAFGTILGERWVQRGAEVEYTVYFENTRETATTAAKDVRISFPVPENMDATSFRLRGYWIGAGSAGAGGYSRSFGSGVISHQDEFLFGDVPVEVQVAGGPDSVLFLFSTTSSAGFLPVNDASQRGQGGVIFRYKPMSVASSGSRVAALARIRFDGKPALVTNVDSLRIDALPPTSQVTSAEALDGTNVRVRWTGADDPQGTGVRTYDLYARRDSDPYALVLADVPGTEVVLPLLAGSQYGFYTRARDNTFNLQAAPAGDQVAIDLPGTVDAPGDDVPRVFALYQNMPNPFRGSSVIRFDLPRETEATLEVYNVAGRRVTSLLGGKKFPAGRHQAVIDGRTIPAGVYFYRLRAGEHVSSRKLILLGN